MKKLIILCLLPSVFFIGCFSDYIKTDKYQRVGLPKWHTSVFYIYYYYNSDTNDPDILIKPANGKKFLRLHIVAKYVGYFDEILSLSENDWEFDSYVNFRIIKESTTFNNYISPTFYIHNKNNRIESNQHIQGYIVFEVPENLIQLVEK